LGKLYKLGILQREKVLEQRDAKLTALQGGCSWVSSTPFCTSETVWFPGVTFSEPKRTLGIRPPMTAHVSDYGVMVSHYTKIVAGYGPHWFWCLGDGVFPWSKTSDERMFLLVLSYERRNSFCKLLNFIGNLSNLQWLCEHYFIHFSRSPYLSVASLSNPKLPSRHLITSTHTHPTKSISFLPPLSSYMSLIS